jgi:arylsulfatase A-like enzyme
MRLRHRLLFRPVLACLLAAAAPLPASAALEGSRPNIVVVMTDDQGYAPIGRHGHPWIRTPHLDQLHDQSTRLTRFLVSPTCSPTRAALMTGRHPEKNGITHTILERERLTLSAVTLPQTLAGAGYTSGIFGKWHLGDEDDYQPGKRGFDEVFIHGGGGIGQSYPCSCADAPGNSYYDPVVRHNGRFVKTSGFCTDVFFTAALGWIKERAKAEKPFFAYIATNAPHGPFLAPERNAKRFTDLGFGAEQAGFYGMIENIDENMGRLIDKLGAWNLLENTVVIFLSDNGMTGGGSGRPGQDVAPGYPFFNADQKGLKGSTDEGGVRVPFFVRWDGKLTPGREIGAVTSQIDLFPTLAALAGAELPAGQVEGRSLLPLLLDPAAEWPDRMLFTHIARWPTGEDPALHRDHNYAVRSHRFRLVGPSRAMQLNLGKAGKKAAPKAGAKQAAPAGPAGPLLYDMVNDPGQTADVSASHPDVVEAMLAAYHRYWEETMPMMVNESAPMSPTQPWPDAYRAQEAAGGIPDWRPPALD